MVSCYVARISVFSLQLSPVVARSPNSVAIHPSMGWTIFLNSTFYLHKNVLLNLIFQVLNRFDVFLLFFHKYCLKHSHPRLQVSHPKFNWFFKIFSFYFILLSLVIVVAGKIAELSLVKGATCSKATEGNLLEDCLK